ATVDGKKIVFVHEKDGTKKTKSDDIEDDLLIPDQIVPFIQSRWDQLMSKGELVFYLVAMIRSEVVKFKIKKEKDTTSNGKPAVVLSMLPTNFIYKAFVDPIYFTFMASTPKHEFVEYKGRVTPFRKDGDKWKDLDAHNIYELPK